MTLVYGWWATAIAHCRFSTFKIEPAFNHIWRGGILAEFTHPERDIYARSRRTS